MMRGICKLMLSATAIIFIAFTISNCTKKSPIYNRNVLLISLDGLRQTNLSLFGYHRTTSPNIDWLGKHGMHFQNIIPSGCSTKASLTSLYTSMEYRYHHMIEHNSRLPDDYETLAEVFKKNGYITAGFTATKMVLKSMNYDQGFMLYEDFSEQKEYVRSNQITSRILKFLTFFKSNKGKPFFIYTHFEEPHPPWFAPSPWVKETNYETKPFNKGCTYIPTNEIFNSVTPQTKAQWKAMYDGAIWQADKQIGLIVDKLRELSL